MLHLNKKRQFPFHLHHHHQQPHKISSRFGADHFSPQSLSCIETFLRSLVREEVDRKVEAHCNNQSSSSKLNYQNEEEAAAGSGTMKFKLCFLDKIPSTIFTADDIQAENGQPLRVALCDITDNTGVNNVVETTHPLSSALIELVVLDGDFASGQREDGIHWNVEDFNKSVVTQRVGERPLLVGKSKTTRLRKGVADINDLTPTTNSSRCRTKMIRLGARIIDDGILANYLRIGEAISNPFRVMDQRGKVNKKTHSPRGDDELYRLKGIGKDGEYQKRLSSNGIKTVDDFVKAYKRDPRSLRKLLENGNKALGKKWNAMVNHALEYGRMIPTFDPTFQQNLRENEAMGAGEAFQENLEVGKQNITPNHGHGFSETTLLDNKFQEYYNTLFEDYSPSLSLSLSSLHGEAPTSSKPRS